MGEPASLHLTFETHEQALEAYRSGLRYGVLTGQFDRDMEPGQRVVVDIQLTFARWGFQVGGEVGDTTPDGSVIYLDLLPSGLVNLFAPRRRRRGSIAAESPTSVGRMSMEEGAVGGSDGDTAPVPVGRIAADEAPAGEPEPVPSEPVPSEPDEPSWQGPEEESFESVSIDVDDGESDGGGSGDDVVLQITDPDLSAVDAGESLSMLGPFEEGIPLPDMDGRTLPSTLRFAGSVGSAGWSPVLLTLVREQLSGLLVVDCAAARYWVYCRDGFPVHLLRRPASSNNAFEQLATDRRMLAPDVARRCRYLAQVSGRSYMSVAARLGLLDEFQLRQLRHEAVSSELSEMLTHIHGSYRFFAIPEVRLLFQHTPASMLHSLVDWAMGQHTEIDEDRAVELLRRHTDEYMYLTPLGLQLRPHLQLEKERQRLLLKLIERGLTLGQAAQSEAGEALPLIQLVLSLYDLGLVELGPNAPGAARERDLAEGALRALHSRLGSDLFTLIGCHWADDERTLEKGLKRARAAVAAVPQQKGEPEDLTSARREVEASLDKVATTLMSPGTRRAYRDGRIPSSDRRLAAAQLAIEGAMASSLELRKDARARLTMVLELDPGGAGSKERTERVRLQLRRLE